MTSTTHAGLPREAQDFLDARPGLEFVEAFVVDLNGIARGKRLPASALSRVFDSGLCLPASTLALDVWGRDVQETGLVFETGDADHPCRPVPGSLRSLPWSRRAGAQVLLQMLTVSGEPFLADPRNILQRVASRFQDIDLFPVVATELEFRLFDASPGSDGAPRPPAGLARSGGSQLYGLDELDTMEEVFAEMEQACLDQDLPADTIIAEQSDGQYEINLRHVGDALLAADQAVLLKRTIKAVARRHGMMASFMAKPLGDEPGNGMHVHVSLVDSAGRNVFADTEEAGSELLQQALGGLTETMVESTALFAPHANSFRRFQPGCHVPMAPTWGYDNRTTALRVPLARPEATRIEHRVAGADANPYLVLAAVLAGIHHGLEEKLTPPPETRGDACRNHPAELPIAWETALASFEQSEFVADYLGKECRRLFAACKRQEIEQMRRNVPRIEYETYLGTI